MTQANGTHVVWKRTVSVRNVYHAGGKAVQVAGKHAGKQYDVVRRRIDVPLPALGSTMSQFSAEMEQEGNEVRALRGYCKGSTLEATDADGTWSDLPGGKPSDKAALAYVQSHKADFGDLLRALNLTGAIARAKVELASGESLDSSATEEDAKTWAKEFSAHVAALETTAASRATARIGAGG